MQARPVVALDFDGVLCDSARETAVSAWRAGGAYWPEWRGPEPPPALLQRFLEVRPYLETGYQAVIMMRMAADGLPDSDFSERLDEHCNRWLEKLGTTREGLVDTFARARDRWIAEDEADWLGRHRFYPGVAERLTAALADHDVHILTTKQERFCNALLAAAGIPVGPDRVQGLDRGCTKAAMLAALSARHRGCPVHFVEDRAEALRAVLALPELAAVRLYYAVWGYGTPGDLAWASRESRVRVWTLDTFLQLGGGEPGNGGGGP
ncbi:MAG: HAD family hydrolase [Lentisphaeria bacterium]|nr:HAD family hydrolase [Lentisphaeria bacterium]